MYFDHGVQRVHEPLTEPVTSVTFSHPFCPCFFPLGPCQTAQAQQARQTQADLRFFGRDTFAVEETQNLTHTWQPLGKTRLKAKLLVGPKCKIPRSTQRSCSGIRLT